MSGKTTTTSLVIVESAAKAKTITTYLNDIGVSNTRFEVLACLGHIQDLPDKDLGIDKTTWKCSYIVNAKKKNILTKLKERAKYALSTGGKVYIASDADMEGHAIANHLKRYLKLSKKEEYGRVMFREITKHALKHAFSHPCDIDENAVAAQETRRILDRVVGWELSPLLWSRFPSHKALSAGRVQSAVLKMVVKRYRMAKDHVYTPYWVCSATFNAQSVVLNTKLGEGVEFDSIKRARSVLEDLSKQHYKTGWIATFKKTQVQKKPPAPFTTSTLQQECFQRFGLSTKVTMRIAQTLYEAGHITYMRTDSTTLSKEATGVIQGYVGSVFGEGYCSSSSSSSSSCEMTGAHEAIRPTTCDSMGSTSILLSSESCESKVYNLIWCRAIASQMAPAIYAKIAYTVTHPSGTYIFNGSKTFPTFDGFLKVYHPDENDKDDVKETDFASMSKLLSQSLHKLDPIEFVMAPNITRPKPQYNEATLVKAMEKDGIGRPSTYASIVDKLYDKGYVVKLSKDKDTSTDSDRTMNTSILTLAIHRDSTQHAQIVATDTRIMLDVEPDISKYKNAMIPSSTGQQVTDYLESVTPYLLDPKFTKLMESDLDRIMTSEDPYHLKESILNEFYKTFSASLSLARSQHTLPTATKSTHKPPIREFKSVGQGHDSHIINTKYGPALVADGKFYSIQPFIEWTGKTVETLTIQDAMFITSLPRLIPSTTNNKTITIPMYLAMGRYGMYIKQGDQNIRLHKSMWQRGYDGKLTYEDVCK